MFHDGTLRNLKYIYIYRYVITKNNGYVMTL